MYIKKNELYMILSIINMYLKKYSWKDLEIFREKIIKELI